MKNLELETKSSKEELEKLNPYLKDFKLLMDDMVFNLNLRNKKH